MPAKSPEEMVSVWSDAFNRGDVESLVALYEPGAALVRLSSPTVIGQDAIREAFAGFLATKPRIEATTCKVVSAGDVALTFGGWTLRATGTDGALHEVTGRSTEVLRRQPDGTWRHVIDDPHSA